MTEQTVYRKNEYQTLKKLVCRVDPDKIFLIRGKGSYQSSGAEKFIENLFLEVLPSAFYNFDPNPQIEDLRKGLDLFNVKKYELIIAIGGGSVLDMAKLISVFAHQNQKVEDIVQGKFNIEGKKTSVLAIPTTAGSGAEATQFAVLYIDKKKYSIGHAAIRPDIVYLSPEFSHFAKPYLKACSGLDAFCQAVESIWNVNATKESLEYGYEAAKIIWNNLENAVKNNDESASVALQEASYLAGKAINITKTTAPHALSYAFTSYYNIPHGHAVALSLPFFFDYNYNVSDKDCNDPRGDLSVKIRIEKLLETLDLSIFNMNTALRRFFNSVNINLNINELINNFDPDVIINNVNVDRLNNNPRVVTKQTIYAFLK